MLKAYQENSNLEPFSKALGKPEFPIEQADETALFQVINQLSPLVIVDESHHARSELSLEMLKNFNPCFVLDLTATPKSESNIISYVDAVQLKKENMVKLPVIVYNRDGQGEVLTDAIDLRNRLEELAESRPEQQKQYIRPIVLFQAQPKGKENSTTFEKLRDKLVEIGIPAEQIAIRTADVNELKSQDLLSSECPIRYIITVNALKEGWDCPFAYILASLANKTSQVDVEQILGRILRLPHTTQYSQHALNLSYVLTSSNDFDETVKQIVKGLNSAGFSDKDYRLSNYVPPKEPEPIPVQLEIPPVTPTAPDDAEDFLDFDTQEVSQELERRQTEETSSAELPRSNAMLEAAEQAGQEYDASMEQSDKDPYMQNLPWEVRNQVTTFQVKPEFQQDIETLEIPQFFQVVPPSLFSDGMYELLEKEQLADNFTLKGKAYDIDFSTADDEIAEIDVREKEGGLPKAFKMEEADQRYFKEHFRSLPPETRIRQCKDMMFHQLNKLNMVDSAELRSYIERIVGDMDKDQLAGMEKAPLGYAVKIKDKIDSLLTQHYKETFTRWLETERIVCRPFYKLPAYIHPTTHTNIYGGSLYQAEEGNMDKLELALVREFTALANIKWWHRNISKKGFCINGFINHYPDFIVMTRNGKIILVEPKGEHLKNDESRKRIELGRAWKNAAGSQYRYYMVFQDGDNLLSGAVSVSQFVDIIKAL